MGSDLEKLAYEAALRGLDRQEGLLEELRARPVSFSPPPLWPLRSSVSRRSGSPLHAGSR